MAYNSALNLFEDAWAAPQQSSLSDPAKSMSPELYAIAVTESDGVPAAYRELSVPAALRRVLDSDGMDAVIAFVEQTGRNSGTTPQAISAGLQARVLPFTWEELVARVNSVLEDARANSAVACFGDVCIDFASMEVSRSSGEKIMLTAQEFKALKFFALNPGRVISRDELLNKAWGYDNYPCSRTVDNHVLKLRHKLETEPSRPKHIVTVHGVGYKFLP